jgi:hypothetical protein
MTALVAPMAAVVMFVAFPLVTMVAPAVRAVVVAVADLGVAHVPV